MRYKFKIIQLLVILFLYNFSYAQEHDTTIVDVNKEAQELIQQMDKRLTHTPGAILNIAERFRTNGKQEELLEFVKGLLQLENSALKIEEFNEIFTVVQYVSENLNSEDILKLDQKLFARKKLIYDQFVAQQYANLQMGDRYRTAGLLDKARQSYSEVFSVPYYKLSIGEGDNIISYSKQLFPLQQKAYIGLLEIAGKEKDTTLLSVLSSDNYKSIYNSSDYIFESLNSKLASNGLKVVDKPAIGRLKIDK